MPRMHIVATTIWLPRFLDSYRENLERHGHLRDAKIWVVGDRKTPAEAAEHAAAQSTRGLNVEYLDPPAQEAWLARFPDLAAMIPWNSDNRRNVGFLRALEEGCEILVSIDDDNYCVPESDFYGGHAETGAAVSREVFASGNGWFDICGELVLRPAAPVVARGFPHRMRGGTLDSQGIRKVPLAANAGLWLGDPDVDAATRLACPVEAVASRGRALALSPGTWTPINTQNTSVAQRAIPAYYYVRMLEPLPGATLDRYGDIWSGYFLTRCAEHLGECVGVGRPVVTHRRNAHDLLADLRAEFWGMVLTPHLIELLRGAPLAGSDYSSAAKSLAALLESRSAQVEEQAGVPGVGAYLARISGFLRIWVDVCAELGA